MNTVYSTCIDVKINNFSTYAINSVDKISAVRIFFFFFFYLLFSIINYQLSITILFC